MAKKIGRKKERPGDDLGHVKRHEYGVRDRRKKLVTILGLAAIFLIASTLFSDATTAGTSYNLRTEFKVTRTAVTLIPYDSDGDGTDDAWRSEKPLICIDLSQEGADVTPKMKVHLRIRSDGFLPFDVSGDTNAHVTADSVDFIIPPLKPDEYWSCKAGVVLTDDTLGVKSVRYDVEILAWDNETGYKIIQSYPDNQLPVKISKVDQKPIIEPINSQSANIDGENDILSSIFQWPVVIFFTAVFLAVVLLLVVGRVLQK